MQENYFDAERRVWWAIRLADWHRLLPKWMWSSDIDSIGLGMTHEDFIEIDDQTRRAKAIIEYKHVNWRWTWTVAIIALARLATDAKVPFFIVLYDHKANTFSIRRIGTTASTITIIVRKDDLTAEQYCRFLANLHDRDLPTDFVVPEFPEYVSPGDRLARLLDKFELDLTSSDANRGIWAMQQLRHELALEMDQVHA